MQRQTRPSRRPGSRPLAAPGALSTTRHAARATGWLIAATFATPAAAQWIELSGPVPLRGSSGGVFDLRRDRVVRPFEGAGHLEGTSGGWHRIELQVNQVNRPVMRTNSTMAYDSNRARLVLFSGRGVQLLSDTWAWDGTSWTRLQSIATPPRRIDAGMGFDPARDQMFLAGGMDDNGQPLTDLWTLRGDQWQQASGPPYSADPVLAFHAATNEMILVGFGAFHHNGTTWRAGNTQVSSTSEATLAYDPVRQVTALLRPARQILEFDGTAWQASPTVVPATATAPAAHFDPTTGGLVLASWNQPGRWQWDGTTLVDEDLQPTLTTSFTSFADLARNHLVAVDLSADGASTRTWLHDGQQWSRARPTNNPPPGSMSSAYDSTRGLGVLFGTRAVNGVNVAETWTWDGADWTQRAGGPPTRRYAMMSYDSVRDRVVLTGGLGTSAILTDLWEWDGAAWLQRATTGPSLHVLSAMAFDPVRGRTVAVESIASQPAAWEWDGSQWQLAPVPPSLSSIPALTFDQARGRIIMASRDSLWDFDGVRWQQFDSFPVQTLPAAGLHVHPARGNLTLLQPRSLLEYQAFPYESAPYGTACGSPSTALMFDGLPRLGATGFQLQVAAEPGATVRLALAGAAADAPFGNGCRLLIGPAAFTVVGTADLRGLATFPLPIAANTALLGLDVFAQAGAMAPAWPGGFTTSQGLRLRIGG